MHMDAFLLSAQRPKAVPLVGRLRTTGAQGAQPPREAPFPEGIGAGEAVQFDGSPASDRGRDDPLVWDAPPSEPDVQISRIRLSG